MDFNGEICNGNDYCYLETDYISSNNRIGSTVSIVEVYSGGGISSCLSLCGEISIFTGDSISVEEGMHPLNSVVLFFQSSFLSSSLLISKGRTNY